VLDLDLGEATRVLDVGTGSGCLALTLASERRGWRVTASDRSPAALAVAATNRRRLGLDGRVGLVAADLTEGFDLRRFDLVVANPPYVAPASRDTLSAEILDFEPHQALFARGDGTSVARRLLERLQALPPGAHAALEIGAGQSERIAGAAATLGFRVLEIRPDYASIPRVIVVRRPA
jgi:release factor glutamine methyltransferase